MTGSPFAGRHEELGLLEQGLEDLRAGRGRLFLLTGEPGIGKTRLADELSRFAVARGLAVHWGRSWEAGGAPAYWPFIQVLRSIGGGANVPQLDQTPSQRERFDVFDGVGTFLRTVATASPLVIVLDDLHAADHSSLLLLHFLVRDLRSVPMLVIGTYREAEVRLSPELAGMIAGIEREATVLALRRLYRGEVAELVGPVASDSIETIYMRSEGNPLFVRELLRLRGAVRAPASIRDTVKARLGLLAPLVVRVLEAAAVLGRELDVATLAHLSPAPDDALGSAADAGIVEPLDDRRWRFTHVLLQEALYESVPVERRAALHLAAATALRDRDPAAVAHHLLLAVPVASATEAVDAVLRAARRAMELLAFEDARALLARTVSLVDGVPGEERRLFEVLVAWGTACIRAADVSAGQAICLRAAGLALGDGELLARALLASTYEYTPGIRNRAMIALFDEALATLPAGDGALRARCMAQLAAERMPEPDTQPPIELARAAIAMARRLGDPETLRLALGAAAPAYLVAGEPTERRTLSHEMLRLATSVGDKRVALRAHLFLTNDDLELGDLRGAAAHVHAYTTIANELGYPMFRWVSVALRLVISQWEGRFAAAREDLAETLEMVQVDEARGTSMVAASIGLACASENYDNLVEIEARVRAAFGTSDELVSCIGEMLLAHLYGRAGDRTRAAGQLATVKAHPVFDEIREASWLALLVSSCHLLGDTELAARLYPILLPRAGRMFNVGPIGPNFEPPYSYPLGLLAETLGRHDDAVAHLTAAEQRMIEAGMQSFLARVRSDLARMIAARGDARVAPPAPTASFEFALRREGEYWTITCRDRTARLRDSRGLHVLEQLVASPGQEMHVLQLVGSDDEAGGDAGVVLDPTAVQAYRRRLLDLREQLEEAEERNDAGRVERAKTEIEMLTQELARAVGLGGRERRVGAAAERARTTVQKRLRGAIRKIEDELPELGRHLDQTVRSGMFCGYLPHGRQARKPST